MPRVRISQPKAGKGYKVPSVKHPHMLSRKSSQFHVKTHMNPDKVAMQGMDFNPYTVSNTKEGWNFQKRRR